jgi:hypothetical protein
MMDEQELRKVAVMYAKSELNADRTFKASLTPDVARRFAEQVVYYLADDYVVRNLIYNTGLSDEIKKKWLAFQQTLTKGQKSSLSRALGSCGENRVRDLRKARFHPDLLSQRGIGHISAAFLFLAFQEKRMLKQLEIWSTLEREIKEERKQVIFYWYGMSVKLIDGSEKFNSIFKNILAELGLEGDDKDWVLCDYSRIRVKVTDELKHRHLYMMVPAVSHT